MSTVRSQLAVNGGPKTRENAFPRHPVLGEAEKNAVIEVIESGSLSAFIASPGQHFFGGTKVKEFERVFAEAHGTKHAVSFDSATAALHAAVIAVGVDAGEEVIVPPYTFTSTATCALMHNAIPVFADIEGDTFCLDPAAFEAAITKRTKAVIPVHLFGHPADIDAIVEIARRHDIRVIEDCAQSPGATTGGRPTGTIGDCGIFSFTESKTITTGEGGMLITNDDDIATVARMVRNHGEMIIENQPRTYATNFLGWNYRMTEIAAALGIVQFGRLDEFNSVRRGLAAQLSAGISDLPGLRPPIIREGVEHAFYVYPFLFDEAEAGMSRATFVKAVAAEGIPLGAGYVRPLYLTSIYHENKPSAFRLYEGDATYDKGLCPVTERLYEQDLLLFALARPPATADDMDDVLAAMRKVLDACEELSALDLQ